MTGKKSLLQRICISAFFGSLGGLLVLHPLSMFIHDIIELNSIRFFSLTEIFSSRHIVMAGYFAAIGGIMGAFRASYIHKRILLYEELKFLSVTDELTSLYNRRYFECQMRKELERARRYSHELSLLMIDLDNFKRFNDTYGHRQGDVLLREVASVLKNAVRKPDFVARYGGDEFAVVMPETGKQSAHMLKQRLQEHLKSSEFLALTRSGKVGMSIGAATFPEDADELDGLINEADKCLYCEKDVSRKSLRGTYRERHYQGVHAK